MPPASDLVFVGDVHLDRGDSDLDAFLRYLEGVAASAGRIVLMGDLFNLWIGSEELEQPHHRAVIECLAGIRASGRQVHYLEGNRDYGIAARHAGRAFDAVSDWGLREDWGGRRIWASHGDLVNRRDLQYRAWRSLSRSGAAWWIYSKVPRDRRFAMAESVERRMRGTNLDMKRAFPESHVRAFAAPYLDAPGSAVVLGHFHVERELAAGASGDSRIYVLPEWKGSRRHLRVGADGAIGFEDA